ncbi:hypothetical protein [Azospirillum sp. B4]|uniref:hypothetical protein n=1 Tax=Azospirillum sp. B4 TaxID=95605 RepID=UPI00034582AF|nr:hypothetical protein [Azospirillum sp. B4]
MPQPSPIGLLMAGASVFLVTGRPDGLEDALSRIYGQPGPLVDAVVLAARAALEHDGPASRAALRAALEALQESRQALRSRYPRRLGLGAGERRRRA